MNSETHFKVFMADTKLLTWHDSWSTLMIAGLSLQLTQDDSVQAWWHYSQIWTICSRHPLITQVASLLKYPESTVHHQELVSATTAGVCSPSTPLSAASRVPWCSTAVSSAGTWTMISTRRSALSWARLVSSSLINSGQTQPLQASAMFLRSNHDALACKEISI